LRQERKPLMSKQELKKLARVQDLVGRAIGYHGNDRDPNGFERGQSSLNEAFDLIVDMLGKYPPI